MFCLRMIMILTGVHALLVEQFAAIQSNSENYFSYIPYVSTCNYNEAGVIPGTLEITPLDAFYIFETLSYQVQTTFWGPVSNGLSIAIVIEEYIKQYDGLILYNSPIKNNNREFILYTMMNQSGILFSYSTASLNLENMNLDLNINYNETIDLDESVEDIVENCSPQSYSISFIGNQSFLFVCLEANTGFTFDVGNAGRGGTKVDFSSLQNNTVTAVTMNPSLLSDPSTTKQIIWSSAFFCQDSSASENSTLIVSFSSNSSEPTFSSFLDSRLEISLLIDRVWGTEELLQKPKWIQTLKQFYQEYSAPGQIQSMFISRRGNIFMETSDGTLNYLIILEESGQLIANVTYQGAIVFYGHQNVFFYNSQTELFYKIFVARPIYFISNSNDTDNQSYSSLSFGIECQDMTLEFNYTILWTSLNFPAAVIFPIDPDPLSTTSPVFNFDINEKYLQVGPDFKLFVNSTQSIEATVIDSSTIALNSQTFAIVDSELEDEIFLQFLLVATVGIFSFDLQQKLMTSVFSNPCSFGSVTQATKIDQEKVLITNQTKQKCLCSLYTGNCQLFSDEGLPTSYDTSDKLSSDSLLGEQMKAVPSSMILIKGETLEVKQNLYGLLKEGYMISILVNNSVVIIDLKTKKILSSITMQCTSTNQTNGNIYFRQFYDPFLLLFCQESTSIVEYIVRKGSFVYERDIPLYGFITRSNDTEFYIGFNYVFLAVDPVLPVFPPNPNCCVLRLDPCQYTVSAIQEIVYANEILGLAKVDNIDVALFNKTNEKNSSYLRIYFQNTFVSLNCTNLTTSPITENIELLFKSSFYNFASSYSLQVTFNLSALNISVNNQSLFEPIQLTANESSQTTSLSSTLTYNLNNFCGPIFSAQFSNPGEDNMSEIQINQFEVLRPLKTIGKIGLEFIQIINPEIFGVAELSLNYLMIFVTTTEMIIYDKEFQEVDMYYVTSIPVPEERCRYYLYEVINETAAILISNCLSLGHDFQLPAMVLNYDPNLGILSYETQWTFFPMALQQIYTIVGKINQSSRYVGIQEGPINARTGKLFICEKLDCSPLYISSSEQLLIDYSVYKGQSYFIVISIDYLHLQVWISPQVDNQSPNTSIPSNFSLSYTSEISQQFCSQIYVISANQTHAYVIISCPSYYYHLFMSYEAQSLVILHRFARYSLCVSQDLFQPEIVAPSNQTLQIMYAVCSQNEDILKYQTYQTINSSLPTINTGYLQIFTLNGPSCSSGIYNPLKIIPLSTSMAFNIFISYEINGRQKFIYTSINGFLIDNFATSQPFFTLTFSPLSKNYTYPSIELNLQNPFHIITQTLTTTSLTENTPTIMQYILFGLFCLMSAITAVCLLTAQLNKNKKKKLFKRDSGISNSAEIEYGDTFRRMNTPQFIKDDYQFKRAPDNISSPSRKSEIELFFLKK